MESYRWFSQFAQTAGLVYFVIVFLAVVMVALKPGRKHEFDAAARLPLDEDR